MYFTTRKPTRIANFDYSQPNCYFITICAHNHKCIFGVPGRLNELGRIVERHIQNIPNFYNGVCVDKYVVMPNHVHLILVLEGSENPGVPQIIGLFKTGVTKEIRKKMRILLYGKDLFMTMLFETEPGMRKSGTILKEIHNVGIRIVFTRIL